MNEFKADQLGIYGCTGYYIVMSHHICRQTRKISHMTNNLTLHSRPEDLNVKLLVKIILEIAHLAALIITMAKFHQEVMDTFFYTLRTNPETRPERLLPPRREHCEFVLPTKLTMLPMSEEEFLMPYIIKSFNVQ